MADDLKPMLTKVLASGGEKKFFFAYAAGKRKDGKGDGELAVRGQKPKKADIEGALSDCKQVLEGVCWAGKGPDDGDTVYFQGKSAKLSGTVVSKMALTARRVAGRQYDFQVPSPEEEARAAKLKEGEGDEAPAATTGGDPAAEWKAKLAQWSPAIKKAITDKGSKAGDIGKLLAQATALSKPGGDMAQALAKLTECHALATGAAPDQAKDAAPSADGDETRWTARRQAVDAPYLAVLKKAPPNATLLRSLLAFADGKAEAKDFGKALAGLEKLEKLLQARNGKADAEAGAKAPGANGDEARWTTRRQAIEAPYLKALKQQPDKASQLRAVLAFADGKAEAKDFGKALLGLDKLETVMQAGAGTTNGADPAAEWKKKYAEWLPAIKAAMTAKGPNAADMAKLLAQATALSKPGGDMPQALAKLTECHALATSGTSANGDPAAEWKAKLAQWSPAIKKAITDKGPKAGDIGKLLAQATALSKPGGDMAQALAKLTECHALATSGTSANGDSAAEWKAKLAQWSPAIKTAMAAKGPNAVAIGKLLAQATALSKPGGDMAQALAKLTECHALAASSTVDGEKKEAKAAAKTTDETDSDRQYREQMWKANMDDFGPQIKAAIAAKGPNAAAIAKLFAEATALSEPGGDIVQMFAKLIELKKLVTAAPSASQPDLEQDAKDAVTDEAKKEEEETDADEAEDEAKEEETDATEDVDQPKEPGEVRDDSIREVEAAINRLTADNPFHAQLQSRLDYVKGTATPENISEVMNALNDLKADAAAAQAFADRLETVKIVIDKLRGYPIHQQFLYSVNVFAADAKRSPPPVRAFVAGNMNMLAALEQQARAAMSPAAQAEVDTYLALKEGADRIWSEIEAVGDDDVREELLTQYRQVEKILGSPDVPQAALAEAAKLLDALEEQLEKAAEGTPETVGEEKAESVEEESEEAASEDDAKSEEKESEEAENAEKESEEGESAEEESEEAEGEDDAKSEEKESEEAEGEDDAKSEEKEEAENAEKESEETESAEKESDEAEGEDEAKEAPEDQAETAQPTEGEDASDAEPKTPTARWEAVRNKVLPKLLDEIKEVVATGHPKADKAELELKAVLRQLKAEMVTKQQAAEMERYLKDDDVVASVCELAFDLKTPLLKVLAAIKDQLAA